MTVALVGTLGLAGCSSGSDGKGAAVTTKANSTAPTTDPKAADAALILTMYAEINRAFQRNPDDGVRAIVAAQYPADSADVDFDRCVNTFLPGAKTLPPTKKFHFRPNVATMRLDAGYTVTSNYVTGLHPKGRIYATDVTINDGGRPSVHERHQTILDGRAYQFSSC
ncbi:MAG: hypothetical protein ABIZ34_10480 [Candidatus Limnocylindrales bacterium]